MLRHGGRTVLQDGDPDGGGADGDGPGTGAPVSGEAGDRGDTGVPYAPLPVELRAALREWRAVADTVLRSGDAHELDLFRQRGRQLAVRVAAVLGRPVQFVDPVSGARESIRAGDVPTPAARVVARRGLGREPSGPTPWGTGSAVAAFFAVVVAMADVVLAQAFAGAFGLLWVPANLLVTAGTLPALWLAREVPFWRWPASGAAVGLGAAWVVMLVGMLG